MEYRELRRADMPSFESVVLQGMGELEKKTGLDQVSASLFKSLRSRGKWALFRIINAIGGAVGFSQTRIFVAVSEGQVVGTATVILLRHTGYVVGVATDSQHRGHGIATGVLERVHFDVKRRAGGWLALDVEAENGPAMRLYEKLGYSVIGRFAWYAGPTKTAGSNENASREVQKSEMQELADWVESRQVPGVRDALPVSRRRLSHFEILTRLPGSPLKTWQTTDSGKTTGAVRGSYLAPAKTGYAIVPAWDPALSGDSLLGLLTPVVDWFRALGAERTVVIVSEPVGEWTKATASLGLQKVVSTVLMTKRVPG